MTDHPDGDTPRPDALEPEAATLAEIDRLDALFRQAPDEIEPQIALWTAVAALEHWVLINRGTPEAPRPYAIAADAGSMICIYTSANRAKEAAHASGLVPDGSPVEVLLTPVPHALDWLMSFAANGVVGVTVDYPMLGAWCPLPNLAMLRDRRTASS